VEKVIKTMELEGLGPSKFSAFSGNSSDLYLYLSLSLAKWLNKFSKRIMSANFDFGIRSRIPPMNGSGSTVDGSGGSSLSAVNNTYLHYYATNGSGNLSTEYDARLQLRYSVFWMVVISIAYAAVFAVGIAGNAMVVSVRTL
jgi:hypothetical protein